MKTLPAGSLKLALFTLVASILCIGIPFWVHPRPRPIDSQSVRAETGLEYQNRIFALGRAAGEKHIADGGRLIGYDGLNRQADELFPKDLTSDIIWRWGFLKGEHEQMNAGKTAHQRDIIKTPSDDARLQAIAAEVQRRRALHQTPKQAPSADPIPAEDCGQIWLLTTQLRWNLMFYKSGTASLQYFASSIVKKAPKAAFDINRVYRAAQAATNAESGSRLTVVYVVREGKRSSYRQSSFSRKAAITPEIEALFTEFLALESGTTDPNLEKYLAETPILEASK